MDRGEGAAAPARGLEPSHQPGGKEGRKETQRRRSEPRRGEEGEPPIELGFGLVGFELELELESYFSSCLV